MFASVLCTESLQRTYIEQRILILALGTLGASGNDYRVNYVRALFPNFSTPELLRRTSPCKQVPTSYQPLQAGRLAVCDGSSSEHWVLGLPLEGG
jgi:hypothetical protein